MRAIDHAIVDVLVVKDNKFLFVQEGKPSRNGQYNLPGGHVEPHETIFEVAVREVKDETGYDVMLTGLVGIYQGIYSHINVSGPIVSAKVVGGSLQPSPQHPEVLWLTKEEVSELAKTDKLFTKYPPFAIEHYRTRGVFPLDAIAAYHFDE